MQCPDKVVHQILYTLWCQHHQHNAEPVSPGNEQIRPHLCLSQHLCAGHLQQPHFDYCQ